MNKAIRNLIDAAKEAAKWMRKATAPNELNRQLRKLETAIKKAEESQEEGKRSGYLVLIELADGRKRITATVESGEKYLSRSGMASLGVDAEVTYSAEVNDLEQARETLKTVMQEEQWAGHGMSWAELSRKELIAAIEKVKVSVNKR